MTFGWPGKNRNNCRIFLHAPCSTLFGVAVQVKQTCQTIQVTLDCTASSFLPCLYTCCHLVGNQQVFAHSQIVVVFVVCHFTQWSGIHCQIKKIMVFCFQNCSGLQWENVAQVIEKNFWNSRMQAKFAECFRWLEQFFRAMKSQNNFWNRMLLSCSWRFLKCNTLEQWEFKLEKNGI